MHASQEYLPSVITSITKLSFGSTSKSIIKLKSDKKIFISVSSKTRRVLQTLWYLGENIDSTVLSEIYVFPPNPKNYIFLPKPKYVFRQNQNIIFSGKPEIYVFPQKSWNCGFPPKSRNWVFRQNQKFMFSRQVKLRFMLKPWNCGFPPKSKIVCFLPKPWNYVFSLKL